VAYLRFASVYRSFSSIDDFEKEIRNLREAPPTSGRTSRAGDDAKQAGSMDIAIERDEV
jgi:transcriptional repressor NrdR